jgi:hypothetical protein
VKVLNSIRVSAVVAASLLVTAAIPAIAHHSAAPFDMTKKITVSGTVEKWVWSNPHSWLYIRTTNANGGQDIWGFEAGSAGMLARNGWNSNDMKMGDKVVVTASPARTSGKNVGLISAIKLSNGKVLSDGAPVPKY